MADSYSHIPDAAPFNTPLPHERGRVARGSRRGRGATLNIASRFEREERQAVHDGWDLHEDEQGLRTHVREERARAILTRNTSPDISFDRAINPYRGCEHGCVYCFARPTHGFLGLSAGLDFETRLTAKVNAAEVLTRELARPGYEPGTVTLGAATDPYQPVEARYRLTRAVLGVLEKAGHPVSVVTKSARVLDDLDILSRMAERGLAKVYVSVTTLDGDLARRMEPRTARPDKRIETIHKLTEAGVPTGVLAAPMIPALNDHELETILAAARTAGASEAGYVLLRLPHELKPVFRAWVMEHFPDKLDKAFNLLKSTRGGKEYDSGFGTRMTGQGPYAYLLSRRFEVAAKRLGLSSERRALRTDLFEPPFVPRGLTKKTAPEGQLALL